MKPGILIAILIFLVSCHPKDTRKKETDSIITRNSDSQELVTPGESGKAEVSASPDTTSSEYLLYLIKNDKSLNSYWTQKLDSLQGFLLPFGSEGHLEITRDWLLNDSISVFILHNSGGTYDYEFLLTIKNKHDIISEIKIGDNGDSDLSPENPYFYTQYELIDDRTIRFTNHKITGTEGGDEKDRIISIVKLTIQNNGKIMTKQK